MVHHNFCNLLGYVARIFTDEILATISRKIVRVSTDHFCQIIYIVQTHFKVGMNLSLFYAHLSFLFKKLASLSV